MPLANVNAPRGFSLYRVAGKKEAIRRTRPVLAGRPMDLMAGDAYSIDSNGNAFRALGSDDTPGVVRGIVEGFVFQAIAGSPQGPVSQEYLPASDAGSVIGIEDAGAEFVVQVSTATIGQLAGGDCNLTNAQGPGNELLAQSQQEIDGGSFGTSGTGQFIATGLQDSPADNTIGAYCRIIVKILNKVI